MPKFPPGQTLLIDADDTLWENNVYFERAIAAFISYLNHHEYTPAAVRQALNTAERETILSHGGSALKASPAPSPNRRSNCFPMWPRRWLSCPRATGLSS